MKALTLPFKEAYAIARGDQTTLIRPRSLPRELEGRWIVIHARGDKGMPARGIGRMKFGESVARLDGFCDWPIICAGTWDRIVFQRGRAGFWPWPGDGMKGVL